ncbi:hypothetical protein GCM10009834_32810 [Streptomonospora arabica]
MWVSEMISSRMRLNVAFPAPGVRASAPGHGRALPGGLFRPPRAIDFKLT